MNCPVRCYREYRTEKKIRERPNVETIIHTDNENKPEDHRACIAHLSAEDMLKSANIEEKKFKDNKSE